MATQESDGSVFEWLKQRAQQKAPAAPASEEQSVEEFMRSRIGQRKQEPAPAEEVRDPRRLFARADEAAQPASMFDQGTIGGALAQAPVAAGQMLTESLLMQPPGQASAAYRAAAGSSGWGNYERIAKTLQFMFPAIGGRAPNFAEWEEAAASGKDPTLTTAWQFMKQAQAESVSLARQRETVEGRPTDWEKVGNAFYGAIYDLVGQGGKIPHPTAPGFEVRLQPSNVQQVDWLYNTLAMPGRDRPPLTDDEIAAGMWQIIHGKEYGEAAELPSWLKVVADGLALGPQFAGPGAVAKLAKGAAAHGAVSFGVFNAEQQGLALASGAQQEFDVGQSLLEAGIGTVSAGGAAHLAGKYKQKEMQRILNMDPKLVPADAIAKINKKANLIGGAGTLAGIELSHAAVDQIAAHQELHGEETGFWESALNKVLGVASSLVSAGTMHSRLPGRPDSLRTRETATMDAYTNPQAPARPPQRSVKELEADLARTQKRYNDLNASAEELDLVRAQLEDARARETGTVDAYTNPNATSPPKSQPQASTATVKPTGFYQYRLSDGSLVEANPTTATQKPVSGQDYLLANRNLVSGDVIDAIYDHAGNLVWQRSPGNPAAQPKAPPSPATTQLGGEAATEQMNRAFEARSEGVQPSRVSELAEARVADDVAAQTFRGNSTERLAQALSLGERIPGVARWVREKLHKSTEGEAAQRAAVEKMWPHRLEADRSARKLNEFLNEKTGEDADLRFKLMHALWTKVEGGNEISSQFLSKFSPETIAQGEALLRDVAQNLLAIGRVGRDVNWIPEAIYRDANGKERAIYKRDFDEGDAFRDEAAAGKYGELVGGFQKIEQAGNGYLPHLNEVFKEISRRPWRWSFGGKSAVPAAVEGFLPNEFIRQRTMRRRKSFAEFTQASNQSGRTVDTSFESVVRTIQEEVESITRKGTLEELRAHGSLRRGDQLPQGPEVAEIADAIRQLNGMIGAREEMIRDALKTKPTKAGEVAGLRRELQTLKDELAGYQTSLARDGWVRLEGEKWGEYNSAADKDGPGWYIRRDLHGKVGQGGGMNSVMELGATLHRLAKVMQTAYNPARRILQDWFGNTLAYNDAGLYSPSENWKAVKDNFRFRMADGKVTDRFQEEFYAASEGHFIGGPAEMGKLSSEHFARASKLLDDALMDGKGSPLTLGMNKFAAFLEHTMTTKVPGGKLLGKAAKFYKTTVDEAHALAAFRLLRKRGLSVEDAWAKVARIADYSTLPQGVQRAAMWFSFLRYPAMMGRAYVTEVAPKQAKFFGANIGRVLGLDRLIQRDPASKSGQAAFMGRSLLNAVSKGAQIALPLMLARKGLLSAFKIDDKEWESYLDEQYRDHFAPVRGLMKMLALPTGRTPLGRISHLDLGMMVPWMAPFTYFRGSADHGWANLPAQILNKNILTAPWLQAAFNRDFRLSTPAPGFGPGERFWAAAKQFTPGIVSGAIEEIAANQALPEQERSALRVAARLFGLPLKAGNPKNELLEQLRYARKHGWVQRVEGEDGREYWGVSTAIPGLKDVMEQMIQLYYAAPNSAFEATQRIEGKVKRLEEAGNLR